MKVMIEYVTIDSVGVRIHSQIERQHVIEHFQYSCSNTIHQYCLSALFVPGLCTAVMAIFQGCNIFLLYCGEIHPPLYCMCIVSTTTVCSVERVSFQHSLTVYQYVVVMQLVT